MSASILQPQVQRMIDNAGVYICGDVSAPLQAIVIASMNGQLVVMKIDKVLDPTRFTDGFVVKHGPLLP